MGGRSSEYARMGGPASARPNTPLNAGAAFATLLKSALVLLEVPCADHDTPPDPEHVQRTDNGCPRSVVTQPGAETQPTTATMPCDLTICCLLESHRRQRYTAAFARASEKVRVHVAKATFDAAIRCDIEIPREGTSGSSQSRAERPIASSGETDSNLCDALHSWTGRRPGEASSETAASRADGQTDGRAERQTDGPKGHEGWLAQRARLSPAIVRVEEMLMTDRVGIWIDHRKAVIVSASADRVTVKTLESKVGPHSRYSGRAGSTMPEGGPQDEGGEKTYEERYGQHLDRYSTRSSVTWGNPRLFYSDPQQQGEAKLQLKERLSHSTALSKCIVRIETTDKLTDCADCREG